MSTALDSIKAGLLQAIAHAEGQPVKAKIHRPRPINVKALRAKVGMTQEQLLLASAFRPPPCGTGSAVIGHRTARRWCY